MQAELLRRGELFTDPEFPATNSSLFYSAPASEEIRWSRAGIVIQTGVDIVT